MKRFRQLTAFFLVCLSCSCSTPKALEYREFKNLSIDKLGFSSSTVKMDMVYFNPNNFGLQLKRTELDLFINDVYLGHTSQDYQVTIPRNENFSIPLRIDVDMRHLFKNGLTVLMNNQVTVKVTGTVKVGKANVFMGIPVKYEGKQTFTVFQ